MTTDSTNATEAPRRNASACNEGLGPDAFRDWMTSLTQADVYDFDSEGRGYKKDRVHMMRMAWDAAALAMRLRCAAKVSMLYDEISVEAGKHRSGYDEGRLDALDIAEQRLRGDYPECSGNPNDCPENEGYGCCQRGA